jgi:hypothetical protein
MREIFVKRQKNKQPYETLAAGQATASGPEQPAGDRLELHRALSYGAEEIDRLRRQNEILSAKVEVMDLFGAVFRVSPRGHVMGMGEDAAWLLRRELMKMEAEGKTA